MTTPLDTRKDLKPSAWLERWFHLAWRSSSVAIEFRAAMATFMVMAYIIFVNGSILDTLTDSAGERLAFPAVVSVTYAIY